VEAQHFVLAAGGASLVTIALTVCCMRLFDGTILAVHGYSSRLDDPVRNTDIRPATAA
jgi:hypothetical protein